MKTIGELFVDRSKNGGKTKGAREGIYSIGESGTLRLDTEGISSGGTLGRGIRHCNLEVFMGQELLLNLIEPIASDSDPAITL